MSLFTQVGHNVSPHVVLLGNDPAWIADVRRQAAAMGLGLFDVTSDPEKVLALLSGGFPPVTHLLLQPDCAGALLPELLDLTLGQAAGVTLVLLGAQDPDQIDQMPHAAVMVPHPTADWLVDLLRETADADNAPAPDDALSTADLNMALERSQISARYQPVVRLDTAMPVYLEVLARLDHPELGMLLPDLFVPKIEDAGLSWPFTQAVVNRAFADWSEGRLGSFGLGLAVNFPLDVLLIPDALTWLERRRREAGLPAERISIELTESRPVRELTRLRHATTTLRGMGYQLAIDDVGPELRDYNALLDMSFTALKLDKNLVRESPDSPAANEFLARTIASARKANLTIVAEGVEDADIWRRMKRLGVDQAQGFLIARPLPVSAVALWHRNWCARLNR
jgi:EAL domain-containing protein (putative c-di-GMP-specific phosphodiesterase class I)